MSTILTVYRSERDRQAKTDCLTDDRLSLIGGHALNGIPSRSFSHFDTISCTISHITQIYHISQWGFGHPESLRNVILDQGCLMERNPKSAEPKGTGTQTRKTPELETPNSKRQTRKTVPFRKRVPRQPWPKWPTSIE